MSSKPVKAKGVWKPGYQPGAGRKKGSVNKRSKMLRAVADNALIKGRTPLDVMLRNMRFYDEKANTLLDTLEQKLENKKSLPTELLELLREVSTFRMSAQKCAVDAAPFVHPRLSAIAVKVSDDTIQSKPEQTMSPDELSDYYNQLRLRPTSVVPLTIDHETGDVVHNEESE